MEFCMFFVLVLLSKRFWILLLGPGDGWLPANTLPSRTDLIVKLINFLQGQALGFIDHCVHKSDAEEAAAEPDKEDLGL